MPEEESLWTTRLATADHAYKEWEGLFKCDMLEKYYEGFQWKLQNIENAPYVINYFYSTINEKIAAHLFSQPQFIVSPKPGYSDYDLSFAIQSAQLKEDMLNTIISTERSHFEEEIEAAYLDSVFRFGIVECGYAADWIINPNAGKPLFRSFKKENVNPKDDRIIKQPDELPENEQIYFKRINPTRFRVSGIDSSYLHRCDWVGYYDWVYMSDLRKMKGIRNVDRLEEGTTYNSGSSYSNDENHEDAVKIWHIWSNREQKRLLLLDSPCVELWSAPFTRIPLFTFRWDRRTSGFYPIPPAFQWVSPQDEINDAREQLKNHRKRFIRKFQVMKGMIDEIEKEKFESNVDGELVTVNQAGAISAIDTASLGAESDKSFMIARDDMNIASATSADQRGVVDRMTATQSKLIENHSNRRESREDSKVAKWVCSIGREALLLARDKFTSGTWIKLGTDPSENMLGEVNDKGAAYKWVTSEDLEDGYDFRIDVDITSMSPARFQEEKKNFVEFLSLTSQFPQIAFSPMLIRETAYRCNYRNERVIKELQKLSLITSLGQLQQGNQGQQNVEKMAPGATAQIEGGQ